MQQMAQIELMCNCTTTASYRSVDRFRTDMDGSGGGDFSHAQSTDVKGQD